MPIRVLNKNLPRPIRPRFPQQPRKPNLFKMLLPPIQILRPHRKMIPLPMRPHRLRPIPNQMQLMMLAHPKPRPRKRKHQPAAAATPTSQVHLAIKRATRRQILHLQRHMIQLKIFMDSV